MFNKVLVVCVGNICRSPSGEAALKQLLPNKHIASAGIASEKSGLVGKPADSNAVEVAAENGLDITQHKSQQLTRELAQQYDLILVMEKGHLSAVTEMVPEARGKTMLFGHWEGQKDIPDPYRQSREMFEIVYKKINESAISWAKKL
ncbi:low molecular weight phosphotyrosine protein phosphatase [Shewanella olleyana]|uniref:low molecular weight protein-tyrosine-phosphatase n=1 Tax=Shewanella olleyana TaxID=135626 RepID=UPI00200DAE30|nr:low molecular weight protein-tyrosine-phosphatase [Shewanella olleyana]MCL1067030.1 low molecular weight phosphotyrosine protein phosphatase [Shewanella olleyana]